MQERSKQRIFISYTTIDSEINNDILIKIEGKIKYYGDVYIDLLHNDSIDPQKRVIEELTNSDILIAINTRSIKKSKWVCFELEKAKEKKIQILFLEIDKILNDNFDLQLIIHKD